MNTVAVVHRDIVTVGIYLQQLIEEFYGTQHHHSPYFLCLLNIEDLDVLRKPIGCGKAGEVVGKAGDRRSVAVSDQSRVK